ncbi:MAG: hypothetical protein KDB37_00750 [Ilumatobacter sp.]|nr:hypothetical protein [Ilumatobacter sp.]
MSTPLAADGSFAVYNHAGAVHVIVDLVGYHQDHHHDDRYHDKSTVDSLLAGKAGTADVWTKAQADNRYQSKFDAQQQAPYVLSDTAFSTSLSTTAKIVADIPVSLERGGEVVVSYSGTAGGTAGDLIECSVGTSATFGYGAGAVGVEMGSGQNQSVVAGTRHLSFLTPTQTVIRLVCQNTDATASIYDVSLTATVFPY